MLSSLDIAVKMFDQTLRPYLWRPSAVKVFHWQTQTNGEIINSNSLFENVIEKLSLMMPSAVEAETFAKNVDSNDYG